MFRDGPFFYNPSPHRLRQLLLGDLRRGFRPALNTRTTNLQRHTGSACSQSLYLTPLPGRNLTDGAQHAQPFVRPAFAVFRPLLLLMLPVVLAGVIGKTIKPSKFYGDGPVHVATSSSKRGFMSAVHSLYYGRH